MYRPGMERQTFVTLHVLARRLGLPVAWLKAEAMASRIPSLKAGRRMMFESDAVARALRQRAVRQDAVFQDGDTKEGDDE